MSTYVNYRKIYEQNFGPIPIDENGRSYEIHHIDGNRKNNDISNLKCVSIKEHYDIHYSQGDLKACQAISMKMNLTGDEVSYLARHAANRRIEQGTHNFIGLNKKRINNGTHNFLGDNNPNRKRAKLGLQSSRVKKQQQERVANGTHHWLSGELQKKQVQKQIEEGRNIFIGAQNPNKIQIECPHCKKIGGRAGLIRWHFDNCKQKL